MVCLCKKQLGNTSPRIVPRWSLVHLFTYLFGQIIFIISLISINRDSWVDLWQLTALLSLLLRLSSQTKTANKWIFHTPLLQYIQAISGGGHRLTSESPLYNITCAYREGCWFFILLRSWHLSEPWGWGAGPNDFLSFSSLIPFNLWLFAFKDLQKNFVWWEKTNKNISGEQVWKCIIWWVTNFGTISREVPVQTDHQSWGIFQRWLTFKQYKTNQHQPESSCKPADFRQTVYLCTWVMWS